MQGFGLGYTTFEFTVLDKHVRCSTQAVVAHRSAYYASGGAEPSPCAYRVRVVNTGAVPSDVVVLGFLNSTHAEAPRNKELFGFARVSMLAPGATRIVTLSVPATVLSLVDTLGDERVLAGHYSVQFGVEGSAEGMPELASLEVDGEDVLIFSYDKLKREM